MHRNRTTRPAGKSFACRPAILARGPYFARQIARLAGPEAPGPEAPEPREPRAVSIHQRRYFTAKGRVLVAGGVDAEIVEPDRVFELDLVIVSPEEWACSDESQDPANWRPCEDDGLVVAARVVG